MKRRPLKSINVSISPSTSIKELENIPHLKDIIYNELYDAIKESSSTPSKNIATLFELNNSGYIVEVEEKDWIPALTKAQGFFESKEEFEKCALYKTLITQIYERGSKQNNTGSEQHAKRKNPNKKKKEK